MLQQGLVLLVAGMGIAVSFLLLLSIVTTLMGKIAPKLNLYPAAAPKPTAAPAPAAADEAIAVAIAVASQR